MLNWDAVTNVGLQELSHCNQRCCVLGPVTPQQPPQSKSGKPAKAAATASQPSPAAKAIDSAASTSASSTSSTSRRSVSPHPQTLAAAAAAESLEPITLRLPSPGGLPKPAVSPGQRSLASNHSNSDPPPLPLERSQHSKSRVSPSQAKVSPSQAKVSPSRVKVKHDQRSSEPSGGGARPSSGAAWKRVSDPNRKSPVGGADSKKIASSSSSSSRAEADTSQPSVPSATSTQHGDVSRLRLMLNVL